MKKFVRSITYFQSILVAILLFVPSSSLFAQGECAGAGKLSLDVTLSPVLENAQVLSLASLGVDNKGFGPVLISGTMVNNTDELLTNLFFEFKITAGKIGRIAEITQQAAYPFTLEPNQVVYGTNNDIESEQLPGIEENMQFDGGLTPEGEAFIEDLGGTTLPSDIYTFEISIFQVTNACGKILLANTVLELGSSESGAVLDEKSIFLKTPGDDVGTNASITNQFPQISWEGDANLRYRVVVVNDNGQDSPETLIESAKSTSPPSQGGSLLQFENLDVFVEGNNFQYPSSGAQALTAGQRYFWQVSTEVQTALGTDEVISDIWNFTLTDPGNDVASTTQEIDEETFQALVAIVGEELYTSLNTDGFYFEGIVVDGQAFSGITGVQKLAEIIQKIEDGEIILNSNQ